jgi:hypothetical protein
MRRCYFSCLFDRYLGGSLRLGPVVTYGFNAMHVAINIRTRRWGYLCFHPTIRCFGVWWPWYFYASPNATPQAATFAIGPWVDYQYRAGAIIRRVRLGHNFNVNARREEFNLINAAL